MSANNPRVRQYEIALLRHGRTDDNDSDIIQGRDDTELNERGREQAGQCYKVLVGKHFFAENAGLRVYTSPLKRAARTAELAVGGDWENSVKRDVLLTERAMGSLTGKPKPKERDNNVTDQESRVDATKRVMHFWDRMLLDLSQTEMANPQADGQASHILIVTHNSIIRFFLDELLRRPKYNVLEVVKNDDGQPWQKGDRIPAIGNCGITTIVVTETQDDEGTHWSGKVGPISSLEHLEVTMRDPGSNKPLESQGMVCKER